MQKYLTWYVLLLKERLRHIGTCLQLAAMLLVAFTITQTTLPDTDNVTVGIVSNDSARAAKIYERLRAFSDVYEFVAVDTEEALQESVERAKLECGFAFDEDFDRMIGSGNLTGSIRFYSSQTTNKGAAVAETVYASVLEEYSSELLTAAQQKLYNEVKPERQEKIMERFYGYLDSENVFAVNLCQVETDAVAAEAKAAVYPLQGLLGMLVALGIFLSGLRRFEPGGSFYKGLDKREAKRFFMLDACAAGTLPAILCLAIVLTSAASRGIGTELIHMIAFFVYTVLWCALVNRLFRNYLGMLAVVPVYVVANVLICPVIFDIVTYVPAMQYIRILFPLGIYLY